MDFIAVYPKIEPRTNRYLIYRLCCKLFLFVGTLACIIVNLCVGEIPWCLFVVGGALVFWSIFLYRPLVEASLIQHLSVVFLTLSAYLVLIDWLTGNYHWSLLVAPIVLFSAFLLILLLFFIRFKTQKHNVFPVFRFFWVSLLITIFAATAPTLPFSWPIIVLASLNGVLIILCLFVFRTPIMNELHKKFHLK